MIECFLFRQNFSLAKVGTRSLMHRPTAYSVGDISATITRSYRRKYHQKASFGLRKPRPLADEHIREVEKLTNRLIDLKAGEGSMKWKHTRSLRGEEYRLRKDLEASSDARRHFISEEQTKFSYGADSDELYTSDGSLETFTPGTFVETRR